MMPEEFEQMLGRLISGDATADEVVDIVTNIRSTVSELQEIKSGQDERITELEKLNSDLVKANSKLFMQITTQQESDEEELAEELSEEITIEKLFEEE